MESLMILKIGGNIIDDKEKLSSCLESFASIPSKKILVHGGGKLATKVAEQLGVQQKLIDGRRVTDAETLKVVTMVYAGYINKNIVAELQAYNCNAVGLTGADGNVIQAHKRIASSSGDAGINYGYAGDIDTVNVGLLQSLLSHEFTPVFAPVTHDRQGQLLNTNADTVAQEIAKSLTNDYDVHLVYSFEKSGVLQNAEDESTLIRTIGKKTYANLKESGAIFAGMIPKLDNAFAAINSGVKKVIIGKAEELQQLIKGEAGTTISN